MNRMLATILAGINVLVALIIIILGGVLGHFWSRPLANVDPNIGLAIGLIGGLVVASLLCGVIAIAALMERHLRRIAHDIEQLKGRSAGGT